MYAIDSNQYLKEIHKFCISHAYLDHTSRDPSHFYLEFLKDFYIFRILGLSGSHGTNGSRIHPVFAELEIAPRKWLYDLNFSCIAIYVIH